MKTVSYKENKEIIKDTLELQLSGTKFLKEFLFDLHHLDEDSTISYQENSLYVVRDKNKNILYTLIIRDDYIKSRLTSPNKTAIKTKYLRYIDNFSCNFHQEKKSVYFSTKTNIPYAYKIEKTDRIYKDNNLIYKVESSVDLEIEKKQKYEKNMELVINPNIHKAYELITNKNGNNSLERRITLYDYYRNRNLLNIDSDCELLADELKETSSLEELELFKNGMNSEEIMNLALKIK